MKIDQTVIAQLLTTAIAFFIFFVIAKKLFWTSIIKTIEDRQARIRSEFDRIDELEKKVAQLRAEYDKRIAEIDAEARQLKQEQIVHGKQIAEQIQDQARQDAAAQLERTKANIAIEMDKARAELRNEVIKMTIMATEKVVREQMDDRKQREMVANFVDDIRKQ